MKHSCDLAGTRRRVSVVLALVLSGFLAPADEGLWLYNDLPVAQLKARYGFEPSASWLERVQKASVRFSSGGSGSFVSEDGLVLSNHHVGSDAIQKLSTPERDLMRDGYLARTPAEELACPDLELNVLMDIEDVTARVQSAVDASMSAEQAVAARRAAIARIEEESDRQTGLRSEVVTLFQGGAYHLYRSKRYTDVRLVFAPEERIAFFGGDPDNFEYPRYCLDMALFRVYEDGKPVTVEHYLPWSGEGVREGDLVLVSGHPGRTSRQLTVAEFETLRDEVFPAMLERLRGEEVTLLAWSARGAENRRRAMEALYSVQNGRKARVGGLMGLQDPALMERIREEERAFRARLAAAPEWRSTERAYERIERAQQVLRQVGPRYRMLEAAWGFRGELFPIARTLLRAAEERARPNAERLAEYRDSNRVSLELELFSSKPIHADFETVYLAHSLSYLVGKLGAEDPVVKAMLGGRSPRQCAVEAVTGTRLAAVEVRRALYEGGQAAVAAANDPLLRLASAVDAEARRLRARVEEQQEVQRQAHAEIARARFALKAGAGYPDATGTLRLSFGVVKGYTDDGAEIPAFTVMGGLYERAAAQGQVPPFDVPPRWLERKRRVEPSTPFNFVSTADIIGGNSGSPVLNRAGELAGLIFDGNLPSLVLDFAYDDRLARALSVDSRGMLEALRNVYRARALVEELTRGRRGAGGR